MCLPLDCYEAIQTFFRGLIDSCSFLVLTFSLGYDVVGLIVLPYTLTDHTFQCHLFYDGLAYGATLVIFREKIQCCTDYIYDYLNKKNFKSVYMASSHAI